MTPTRLRLLILRTSDDESVGSSAGASLDTLRSALDVVEVENAAEALAIVREAEPGTVLLGGRLAKLVSDAAQAVALAHAGEAVAIVDRGGLAWSDERLQRLPAALQQRTVECCTTAIEQFNRASAASAAEGRPTCQRYVFGDGAKQYELVVSVAEVGKASPEVRSVVGVLVDVTARHRLQQKVDAIDAAGAELMRMDATTIGRMNMAERLRLLEDKVVRYVHDLLNFDHFEIRLLDKETGRLELVVAKGISPLKIGEVIHARADANGISGYVASTGRSYICADVRTDPLYREGLDDAASSLTVPLRLHDDVIGVFNVESDTPDAFDRDDRQFAEIFCRYVAMAMHILDLLVVERYTTNEQVSSNVLGELREPLDDIERRVAALGDRAGAGAADGFTDELAEIREAVAGLRRRVTRCASGPRTILDAEQEMQAREPEEIMRGRRVLLADNDEEIRTSLVRLLTQKGCEVTACCSGLDTIAALERSVDEAKPYDLVLSDIKMPDRTGYEIFRATREIDEATPVILMTGFGYDPHHSIIRASQEGLAALLFKPFKAGQLLEVMRKAFTEKLERA